MQTQKLFLIVKHRFAYLPGVPAEVIGAVVASRDGLVPRPSYHIRYADGHEDYVPIDEPFTYQLIAEDIVHRLGRTARRRRNRLNLCRL